MPIDLELVNEQVSIEADRRHFPEACQDAKKVQAHTQHEHGPANTKPQLMHAFFDGVPLHKRCTLLNDARRLTLLRGAQS